MASLRQSTSLAQSSSRPTTPIRRISRGSLSYSLQGGQQDPLDRLAPLFTELADSFEVLAENFQLLNAVNDELDSFNNSFAAYLYGLKMNAYTTDFTDCPVQLNFKLDAERQAKARQQQEKQGASQASSSEESEGDALYAEEGVGETTYQSFGAGHADETYQNPRRGGTTVRGTRGRGRGRGGGPALKAAARKKEQAMEWVLEVVETLEIKYREEQPFRGEMEQILLILREASQGLRIPDIVKKSSPPLQSHRINAALISLTRARHVTKTGTGQGLVFSLDPTRHPRAR